MKMRCDIFVRCGSGSGSALAMKQGFGRAKHIDVKMAWIQEAVSAGAVRFALVRAKENITHRYHKLGLDGFTHARYDTDHTEDIMHTGGVVPAEGIHTIQAK